MSTGGENPILPLMQEKSKMCTGCLKMLTFDFFNRDGSQLLGLRSRCKECEKNYRNKKRACPLYREKKCERSRRWHQSPRGKELRFRRDLKALYGLSVEQYNEMVARQNNLCLICGEPPFENTRLAIDHCHTLGTVRGLIHRYPCNTDLGTIEKYIKSGLIYNVIDYLKKHYA